MFFLRVELLTVASHLTSSQVSHQRMPGKRRRALGSGTSSDAAPVGSTSSAVPLVPRRGSVAMVPRSSAGVRHDDLQSLLDPLLVGEPPLF